MSCPYYISDSGPCILRPPVQPEEYGLKYFKLKVVLKLKDTCICIENIKVLLGGRS